MLLIGAAGTEFRVAADMARARGADVRMADDADAGLACLHDAPSDMVMIDVRAGVPGFMTRLAADRLTVPVLACGIDASAVDAVAAIRAGARDYVPLPLDADMIAAAILSITGPHAPRPQTSGEVSALVGQTVEAVERDLILRTLDACRGNRTCASAILGISVRTMRNKLKTFIEAGIPVAPALQPQD